MPSMFFNDVEAAKIAVNMERNGLDFYNRMAGKSKDPAVRRVFEQLASDETEHIAVFEALEQTLLEGPRRQSYLDNEVLDAYMQRLVETHVFADAGAAARMADEADNDIVALAVGMRAERDTILFYQEMLGFTDSKAAREALERIVEEERRHLVLLAERSEACQKQHG